MIRHKGFPPVGSLDFQWPSRGRRSVLPIRPRVLVTRGTHGYQIAEIIGTPNSSVVCVPIPGIKAMRAPAACPMVRAHPHRALAPSLCPLVKSTTRPS